MGVGARRAFYEEKEVKELVKNRLISPNKLLRSNPSFTKIAPNGFLHSHLNLQGTISVIFGSLSIVAHKAARKKQAYHEKQNIMAGDLGPRRGEVIPFRRAQGG